MLLSEPEAIDAKARSVLGGSIVSPSRTVCSRDFPECGEKGANCEQMHGGVFWSAHWVAMSLWLHRLSMTEGYLVKTIEVDGDCSVMLCGVMVCMWSTMRCRKRLFHSGAKSQGARRGIRRRTAGPFQNLMARSMAWRQYERWGSPRLTASLRIM